MNMKFSVLTLILYIVFSQAIPFNPSNEFHSLERYEISPHGNQIVIFANETEFYESKLLRELEIRKNPDIARKTFIVIKDSNLTLGFDDSEMEYGGSIWNYIRPRRVKFKQVSLGKFNRLTTNTLPVSNCASSQLSSGGVEFKLETGWNKGLSLDSGFLFSIASGIRFDSSIATSYFSLGYSSTSSVTCLAKPGETVQVLGSMTFALFPDAKYRHVEFSRQFRQFVFGNWNSLFTNKKFKALGVVMYDNNFIQKSYCSTDPDLIDCNFDFENDDTLEFRFGQNFANFK